MLQIMTSLTGLKMSTHKDFKAAIASIYGDEVAAQFEKIWTGEHIKCPI